MQGFCEMLGLEDEALTTGFSTPIKETQRALGRFCHVRGQQGWSSGTRKPALTTHSICGGLDSGPQPPKLNEIKIQIKLIPFKSPTPWCLVRAA